MSAVIINEDTYERLKPRIAYLDDEKLVLDITLNKWLALFSGLFCLAFFILFFYVTLKEELFSTTDTIDILTDIMQLVLVNLPLVCGFGYFTLRFLLNPKRLVTFNRLENTVEIPASGLRGGWWGRTFLFNYDEIYSGRTGLGTPSVTIFHRKPWTRTDLEIVNSDEWNLIFDYMQRDRELPNISVFDQYRERDAERRKAREEAERKAWLEKNPVKKRKPKQKPKNT